jgi:hypothetical protein
MLGISMSQYAPFISGLFGLLGVVVGALWTRYSGKQQQKTANTFLLHSEFCGKEMNEVRYLAGELIKKHPTEELDALYRRLPTQETTPLWTLMDFYNRLWISLKHNQLQDSLVPPWRARCSKTKSSRQCRYSQFRLYARPGAKGALALRSLKVDRVEEKYRYFSSTSEP